MSKKLYLKFGLVIIFLGSALINSFKLHNALLTGIEANTFIKPQYGYMKSADNLPDNASSKFGADFMCLYFSAKGYVETGKMYDNSFDPWNRPAFTFPPNLIHLTSLFVGKFNFINLLFLNNYLQIFFISYCSFLLLIFKKISFGRYSFMQFLYLVSNFLYTIRPDLV